jgi:hypothetical protein
MDGLVPYRYAPGMNRTCARGLGNRCSIPMSYGGRTGSMKHLALDPLSFLKPPRCTYEHPVFVPQSLQV